MTTPAPTPAPADLAESIQHVLDWAEHDGTYPWIVLELRTALSLAAAQAERLARVEREVGLINDSYIKAEGHHRQLQADLAAAREQVAEGQRLLAEGQRLLEVSAAMYETDTARLSADLAQSAGRERALREFCELVAADDDPVEGCAYAEGAKAALMGPAEGVRGGA